MKQLDIDKFKNWLLNKGCEILPVTNEYEELRFRGIETGVLYKSGKVSNGYTAKAISCYKHNKIWDGMPVKIKRSGAYWKVKKLLLKRDGTGCFYCGSPLGEDITVEHLLSLASGGKDTIGNMVLCHEKCNHEAGNITIVEKVKSAISNRLKNNDEK